MKKITLLAVAFVAISFASCKKNQTCTCTTTYGGTSVSSSATIKDTKKKAKEACEKGSAGYVTCSIQ